ncbi:MAG TPA: class I SAM-dependent methyltransferase [Pseudogracilibacillus sp.]|nr:class I SAM-dependent methyltransferase [Pseudogracilibacillus sp.]
MKKPTNKIKERYNRISKVYNIMDHMIRSSWRKEILSDLKGEILEVGVGTGASFEYYPMKVNVTGIDFSPKMLDIAQSKIPKSKAEIKLLEMDIEQMNFPDNSFDTVISSCVFCSVPNPIEGLKEIRRVVKPEGKIIMLEHMRSENAVVGKILDLTNPFTVRLTGANVNRETIKNLEAAGLKLIKEEYLMTSIMRKLIISPNK